MASTDLDQARAMEALKDANHGIEQVLRSHAKFNDGELPKVLTGKLKEILKIMRSLKRSPATHPESLTPGAKWWFEISRVQVGALKEGTYRVDRAKLDRAIARWPEEGDAGGSSKSGISPVPTSLPAPPTTSTTTPSHQPVIGAPSTKPIDVAPPRLSPSSLSRPSPTAAPGAEDGAAASPSTASIFQPNTSIFAKPQILPAPHPVNQPDGDGEDKASPSAPAAHEPLHRLFSFPPQPPTQVGPQQPRSSLFDKKPESAATFRVPQKYEPPRHPLALPRPAFTQGAPKPATPESLYSLFDQVLGPAAKPGVPPESSRQSLDQRASLSPVSNRRGGKSRSKSFRSLSPRDITYDLEEQIALRRGASPEEARQAAREAVQRLEPVPGGGEVGGDRMEGIEVVDRPRTQSGKDSASRQDKEVEKGKKEALSAGSDSDDDDEEEKEKGKDDQVDGGFAVESKGKGRAKGQSTAQSKGKAKETGNEDDEDKDEDRYEQGGDEEESDEEEEEEEDTKGKTGAKRKNRGRGGRSKKKSRPTVEDSDQEETPSTSAPRKGLKKSAHLRRPPTATYSDWAPPPGSVLPDAPLRPGEPPMSEEKSEDETRYRWVISQRPDLKRSSDKKPRNTEIHQWKQDALRHSADMVELPPHLKCSWCLKYDPRRCLVKVTQKQKALPLENLRKACFACSGVRRQQCSRMQEDGTGSKGKVTAKSEADPAKTGSLDTGNDGQAGTPHPQGAGHSRSPATASVAPPPSITTGLNMDDTVDRHERRLENLEVLMRDQGSRLDALSLGWKIARQGYGEYQDSTKDRLAAFRRARENILAAKTVDDADLNAMRQRLAAAVPPHSADLPIMQLAKDNLAEIEEMGRRLDDMIDAYKVTSSALDKTTDLTLLAMMGYPGPSSFIEPAD
ncbi:hypothetical protein NMY22_g3000 [Coprinellus aureogranulatus]|nr:hypothetical protein NMY22_g3000 [Coprinellus aureogranulatus]